MVQGTGSNAGKSLLVTALCRAARRRGLRVFPFKPQNMSNNAAVAPLAGGGCGELARAQALQARAAGCEIEVDLNPILLKPETEGVSSVVVRGVVRDRLRAAEWMAARATWAEQVMDAWHGLAARADLMLVEGAGSAAETNLRAGDLANMGFAEAADIPVALVGDIERGGVIAQLVGTHILLSESERARVCGFWVNRFRGDRSLFDEGVVDIERRTGWDSLGVLPWCDAARNLPPEDGLALEENFAQGVSESNGAGLGGETLLRVAVPRLARISNAEDLDPLRLQPGIELRLVAPGQSLCRDCDLVLLPGSKSVRAELEAFRACGWERELKAFVARGGAVVGICGGYQMLGASIADPEGVEGTAGTSLGLGLLGVETRLQANKTLRRVSGEALGGLGAVSGYEIHNGETRSTANASATPAPFLQLSEEGAGSPSFAEGAQAGRVYGTCLHGLFQADEFRTAFFAHLFAGARLPAFRFDAALEEAIDAVADFLEENTDIDALFARLGCA